MSTLVELTRQQLREWRDRLHQGQIRVRVAQTRHRFLPGEKQVTHEHPEIFLQIHGENHFTLPDGHFVLHEGEALLMPAGVPHHETARDGREPFRMVVLGLSRWQRTFIHGIRRPSSPTPVVDQVFCTPNPDAKAQRELITSMEQYLGSQTGSAIGVRLLGVLLEELTQDLALPTTHDWKLQDQSLTQKTLQLVQARFRDAQCNVATLAREMGVSPNYLSGRFRAETGERLSQLLVKERLEHAQHLLKETNLRIVEIAAACGFSDASPFIARFKAWTGLTPLRYRETYRIPVE